MGNERMARSRAMARVLQRVVDQSHGAMQFGIADGADAASHCFVVETPAATFKYDPMEPNRERAGHGVCVESSETR